jgi:hypothetical protein
MIVTAPAVIRTYAAADYTGKSCRLAHRCLGRRPPVVQRCGETATASVRARTGLRTTSTASRAGLSHPPSRLRPLHRRGGRCVDDESPRGGRVNVHTSVATGVNARARTGSPVPIGAEPFRQGCEHGHGRFWPLLKYGV